MRRKYKITLIGMVLFGSFSLAWGQTQSTSVPYANTIAPFIDDQTFAVARLDVSRIDVGAFFNKALEFFSDDSKINAAILEEVQVPLNAAKVMVFQWQQVFLQAGGKEIYGVYSMNDVPYFFVVVPLKPGADVPMLKSWLATVTKGLDVGEIGQEQIGNMLVVGEKATIERIQRLSVASRPELADAFAAAGDAAVQILLLPTPDQRRVIEEMMPSLALPNGEIPSTTLTKGIRWLAAGVNLPPQMSLNVRAKSQDAQAARNLKHFIDQFYAYIGSIPEVQQELPQMNRLLDRVRPSVKEEQVVLTLNTQKMDSLFDEIRQSILPVFQEEICRDQCARQLRRIGNGLAMYHNDNDGKNPPTLKPLVDEEGVPSESLICPAVRARGGKEIYLYRGVDLDDHSPANMIIAYERKGNHKGYRNVLFSGGYVLRLTEEGFQEAVKKDNELRKKNKLPETPAD